jgi:hypothetical protein
LGWPLALFESALPRGGRSASRSACRGPNHRLTAKAGNGPGLRQGGPQARRLK